MQRHKSGWARGGCAALALALTLLAGCGGAAAVTVRLARTEGRVEVEDAKERAVEPKEGLGLYSGYRLGTGAEGYAWVELDKERLAKLDENSAVTLQQQGKLLRVEVVSGSLFFDIARPLVEDETLQIAAADMVVGIRGTRGWVERTDEAHLTLYLLEGTVECTAGGETVTVAAGQRAVMEAGAGVELAPFDPGRLPGFVAAELEEDSMGPAQGGGADGGRPALYRQLMDSWAEGGRFDGGMEPGRLLGAYCADLDGDGQAELLTVGLAMWEQPEAGAGYYYTRVDVHKDSLNFAAAMNDTLYDYERMALVWDGARYVVGVYGADDSKPYRYCVLTRGEDGEDVFERPNAPLEDGGGGQTILDWDGGLLYSPENELWFE